MPSSEIFRSTSLLRVSEPVQVRSAARLLSGAPRFDPVALADGVGVAEADADGFATGLPGPAEK